MGQVVRYQEILRRLAIIDDGFIEDRAGLRLGLAGARVLDAKTAALVQVGALAAIGSPAVCLESPRWPGSAGSSPPFPAWRTRSGMTSSRRWRTHMISDGAADTLDRPGQAPRRPIAVALRTASLREETPSLR